MTPLQLRALRNGAIAAVVVATIGSVAVASRSPLRPRDSGPSTPSPGPNRPSCFAAFAAVPTQDAGGTLNAVSALSASDAWAVGGSGEAGFPGETGVAGATGATGTTGASGATGPVEPVTTAALVERFSGRTWGTVNGPSPGTTENELLGVDAVSPTDAWAVGLTGDGSTEQPLILHFDGSTWTAELPPPEVTIGRLDAVSALGPNDVWAVGSTVDVALGTEQALVLHFDGSAWSSVSVNPGGGGSRLLGVSAQAPDDVWAVGSHHLGPLILHFDGTTWTRADIDAKGPLTSVLAFAPDEVWAAGPAVFHFAGDSWVRRGRIRKGAELAGLAGTSPSDVWAVGSRALAGSSSVAFAMHWDGGRWALVKTAPVPGHEALHAVAAPAEGEAIAVGVRETHAGSQTYAVQARRCA